VSDEEPETGSDDTASLGTPRARAPWERRDPADDEVKHSALVGFMSVPVSRRLPIRRSTFLMVVAFAGFATLLYFNPPVNDATKGAVVNGYYVPGAVPVDTTTTTTTVPPTTTTTTTPPSSTTTTTSSRSSTTASSTSTTTTTTTARGGGGGGSTSTTTSTTTTIGSPSSASSGSGVGGTGTTSTTR